MMKTDESSHCASWLASTSAFYSTTWGCLFVFGLLLKLDWCLTWNNLGCYVLADRICKNKNMTPNICCIVIPQFFLHVY